MRQQLMGAGVWQRRASAESCVCQERFTPRSPRWPPVTWPQAAFAGENGVAAWNVTFIYGGYDGQVGGRRLSHLAGAAALCPAAQVESAAADHRCARSC